MIESNQVPILGINTDPARSLGILCAKFLYKDRTTSRSLNKLMDQLEQGDFSWIERQRMNVKVTQLEKFDED